MSLSAGDKFIEETIKLSEGEGAINFKSVAFSLLQLYKKRLYRLYLKDGIDSVIEVILDTQKRVTIADEILDSYCIDLPNGIEPPSPINDGFPDEPDSTV